MLVNPEATIQTSQGEIGGCRQYQVSAATAQANGLPIPLELVAEVWIKTGVGIVGGWYESPLINSGQRVTWNVDDFFGAEDLPGGRAVVRRDAMLADSFEGFRLSTYDVNGEFDADKDSHAKMLVEIRWADPLRAQTDEEPNVYVDFTAVFGSFPHPGLIPLEASILNPHENGHGYRFWYAYVDQADKHQQRQGISYGVDVRMLQGASARDRVMVSALINYKKVD